MVRAQKPSSEVCVVRRWELTRGALNELLARLDPDPVSAGEKYEHLCRALWKFFGLHQIAEAESCVDETLDRMVRRLDESHTIDDLPALAYGVAKLVHLERRSVAMPTTSDKRLLAHADTPQPEDVEARDACLQRCLADLSAEDRDLIVAYYAGIGRERIDGRAQLAQALGLGEDALRLRGQRLRDLLRLRAAQFVEHGDFTDLR